MAVKNTSDLNALTMSYLEEISNIVDDDEENDSFIATVGPNDPGKPAIMSLKSKTSMKSSGSQNSNKVHNE